MPRQKDLTPLSDAYNPAPFTKYLDTLAQDPQFVSRRTTTESDARLRIEVSAVPIYNALTTALGPELTQSFDRFATAKILTDQALDVIAKLQVKNNSGTAIESITDEEKKELFAPIPEHLQPIFIDLAEKVTSGQLKLPAAQKEIAAFYADTQPHLTVAQAARFFDLKYKAMYNQVAEPWPGKLPYNKPSWQYQIPPLALLCYELAGRVTQELSALEYNLTDTWQKQSKSPRYTAQEALNTAQALVTIYRENPVQLIARYGSSAITSYWREFIATDSRESSLPKISEKVRAIFTGQGKIAA